MTLCQDTQEKAWAAELDAWVRDLRGEVVLLALPGLYVLGFILMGSGRLFERPLQGIWFGAALILVPVVVLLTHRWSTTLSAWVLVAGSLVVTWLVASLGGLGSALWLMALPAGLALATVGPSWGIVVAGGVSLLLVLMPAGLWPVGLAPRGVILLSVIGTVGLIRIALHPLTTIVRSVWTGYKQSRLLVEQARDYQEQLRRTMDDLASANLQLTRFNRLAQGLRQVAEDERRVKEQFVANVSHELRTPLNMIVGFCEMITESPESYGENLPPTLLADLSVVLRNSQHLSGLIDDVLDLSQIEARQMALTKERVSMAEIVQSAVVAVQPLFESKGLYLETEMPGDLPDAFCDPTRIREVTLNLLSNAGRFTERGGARVRVWLEGVDLVVSVADTGPGIEEASKERIFRPFEQLDATTRRRYGGTGLGLSISKSFVELHDGQMWVESEPGRGTEFFFRFPVNPTAPLADSALRWFNPYERHEERPHPARQPTAMVRPRLVLVEQGDSMERLLTRYMDGAEVVAVASLEESVEELSKAPTQALLVNEIDIGEALRRLDDSAGLPYDVPVFVCSVPGAEKVAGDLGVADYLVKPISRERLLEALDQMELKGKTVLVVDDEPDALQLFWRMLASAGRGYRVLTAADGKEAMRLLRTQRPDAMLVDLVMPEMDGFQLLAAKNEDPTLRDVPAIVTSARDPFGQPIVSKALAVTRGGGVSTTQLLDSIKVLTQILAPTNQSGDPGRTAALSG